MGIFKKFSPSVVPFPSIFAVCSCKEKIKRFSCETELQLQDVQYSTVSACSFIQLSQRYHYPVCKLLDSRETERPDRQTWHEPGDPDRGRVQVTVQTSKFNGTMEVSEKVSAVLLWRNVFHLNANIIFLSPYVGTLTYGEV